MAEVRANGLALWCEMRGDGEPVLFVCGGRMRVAQWDLGIRPAVAEAGFATIGFDNRGMGQSAFPDPPWTVGDMADDTIGLIEALEIRPCHLIGASLGAMICQTVALRRPDLVRSVVLWLGGGAMSLQYCMHLRALASALRGGLGLADDLRTLVALRSVLTPAQLDDDRLVRSVLAAFPPLGPGRMGPYGPGGELGQISATIGWGEEDHLDELTGMKPPSLFISHEFDFAVPPANVRLAAARTPNARHIEIPGVAMVPRDAKAVTKVREAIVDFLVEHRG